MRTSRTARERSPSRVHRHPTPPPPPPHTLTHAITPTPTPHRQALGTLNEMIAQPDSRSQENRDATENAISAIIKAVINMPGVQTKQPHFIFVTYVVACVPPNLFTICSVFVLFFFVLIFCYTFTKCSEFPVCFIERPPFSCTFMACFYSN